MPRSSELAAWLRLTLTPGIGGEAQRKLLAAFGLPDLQMFSTAQELHSVAHHLLLHNVRRIAIFVRHDPVHRFDNVDLASKSGK